MSEEIELAAKTTGAVVGAVIESSGMAKPIQEVTGWLAAWIHPRLVASAAKQTMAAVERLEAAGIRPGAVCDEQMRLLIEEGAREEDDDLQNMWANLLANGLAAGADGVPRAFRVTLTQLEHAEAVTLEAIWSGVRVEGTEEGARVVHGEATGITGAGWDNLERRLGLVMLSGQLETATSARGRRSAEEPLKQVSLTPFGVEFMKACNLPQPRREPGRRRTRRGDP
jgi:hypothetical protein